MNNFLEAELLLSYVTGKSKEYILTYPDRSLSDREERNYFRVLNLRKNGYPVEYIIHKKEFYSIEFYVNKSVLIPRPETEGLVDLLLEHVREGDFVVDLGTGSGCIAISFLKNFRGLVFVAMMDKSFRALRVAKRNARLLLKDDPRYSLLCGDLTSCLKDFSIDVIVSNPPYIPSYEVPLDSKEPFLALDGGENDGIDITLSLMREAKRVLKKEGKLILEIDYRFVNKIIKEGEKIGFSFLHSKKDLSQRERYVVFTLL